MIDTLLVKAIEPARWLLILGIAVTLAQSVLSFFDTGSIDIQATAPSERLTAAAARKQIANVNWILEKHLFGEAGAKPEVSDQPAVQTRLPLELRSVFVADEPEQSAAIIAQRGKAGERYAIDDTLPGNAVLTEVLTDRIILMRAGVRETLMFPEWKSQFTPVQDDRSQAPSYNPNRRARDVENDVNPGADGSQPPQAAVDALRERFSADAEAALEELGVEPADGGGYRLGNVADSELLRASGLQAGDVILSVNGRPVGDIQQDQLELENILAQGSARIELQRGQRRTIITVSIPK